MSPSPRLLLTIWIEIGQCMKYSSVLMRMIACSCPISKANQGKLVKGKYTGVTVAAHLKDLLHCFDLTDSHLLRIKGDIASSNYSMTRKLQSTLEDSGIQWPALRNHILRMAQVIELALAAFMSNLNVKGHTKSSEADARNQQSGKNESIEIGKSQRLRKEGNARINKVSAMRPGFATIIETVLTSRYFISSETDLHKAVNTCCIDYANTWSSK